MLLHALPPLHCLLAALLHGLWAGPNCSCQHHKARQWQHSFRLPQIPPEAPLPVFPHHLHHSTALPTCTPSSYPIVQHIELQLKASAPDPFLAQSAVCFRAKGALCMPKILPAFFFFLSITSVGLIKPSPYLATMPHLAGFLERLSLQWIEHHVLIIHAYLLLLELPKTFQITVRSSASLPHK